MDGGGTIVLDISSVERETGLSKDVLRVWERRYGFPKPARDDNGERQYAPEEVAKLRTIKRLMDAGLRPGRIVGRPIAELDSLAAQRCATADGPGEAPREVGLLAWLRDHDVVELQAALARDLMRQGLQRFVLETVLPLNRAVGEAWMRGELQIFEEHLYTEQLKVALRTAINAFPRHAGTPRVLLTTLPGEQHGLGLLMVEALLVPEGTSCISLGVQTPLEDIRQAAIAHRADIVALSFSSVFPVRQAVDALTALRRQLPAGMAIWAGGSMTLRLRRTLPGIEVIPDLATVMPALSAWRRQSAP